MVDYYDGSKSFSWLAEIIGLPIDQMNFLLTQFSALILAGLLRKFLNPSIVTPAVRHVFGLVIGLAFGYFCFGRQAVHLAGLPILCYVVMRTQNPLRMQRVVLATALIYLSCVHYYRQMYNYGSYTLDITGPLMVITQKVTSLAYSVHDGLTRKDEDLTPMQRHQAVQKMPTTLEYFSYVFHFQALMAGPVIFYRDYIDFIHGRNPRGAKSLTTDKNSVQYTEIVIEPSPALAVVKKLVLSLLCAAMFVTLIPLHPIQRIKEDDFLDNTSALYKVWYLIVATMLVRFKYYHAWIFADAICNNSGMGFNGFNDKNEPQWDLISNVDVLEFETSLSFKESLVHWNKGTNRWLRSVAYERAGRYKLIATYALSAVWHGFYPGYYLTFTTGALFTLANRTIRTTIRPYFLGSKQLKFLYDTLTFIITRVIMAYITFTFVLLEFVPCVRVYLHLYLLPHILALAAIFLLPRLPKASAKKTDPRRDEKAGTSSEMSNGTTRKSM